MQIKKFSSSFITITITITLFCLSISQPEKSEKQIRADACIKILKSRMKQDSEFIKHFIDFLTPKFNNNPNDAANRLVSFAMLSCYDKINYYDADSIATSPIEINSLETSNKDLLSLEKWEMLFKENDEQRLNYEMSLLQSAISDFQSGQVDLSALSHSNNNNKNYDDVQQNYNDDMGRIYTKNEDNEDLNIFGINLSKIDEKWKNVIGIGLIVTVFGSIIIGMNWIKNIRNQGKEKKEKKKKKKK